MTAPSHQPSTADAWTLRPFEERDRAALERLADETVRDGTVFPFEDRRGVLDYWLCDGGCVMIGELGGRVVGTYVLKPNHPDRCSHVANAGYMVAEAARGRGLGAALCQHSLEHARALGYLAMQFNLVVKTNHSAVRLWERLGFAHVGEVPGAFRHPSLGLVPVCIMHREL